MAQNRPLTPVSRFTALPSFDEITKSKPEKSLVVSPQKERWPQQQRPHDLAPHRRRATSRRYRLIDFKRRKKHGVSAEVIAIEYDPIRSARMALIQGRRRSQSVHPRPRWP